MCTQLDGVTSHRTAFATASLSAVSDLSHKQLPVRPSCCSRPPVYGIYLFISIHLAFISLLAVFPRLLLIMP